MFTRIAISVALLTSLTLARPEHRLPPPRKNPPVRPYLEVRRNVRAPANSVFSFKYSLRAHGIKCTAINNVSAINNRDGTITITVDCSF